MTNMHADDAFLNYYQFNHDPFTPRVPGFKFYPAQRKSVLGQLHHLARYDQALLLVTGPKGSGKTLLRQALVASTNKQAVQSLVLAGRECSTADGVLSQIVRGVDAASSSISSILKRAGQLALTGQEEYLLVDDADLMDDSALQIFLALAAGNGEGRLHVFLFAEAALADRLHALVEGAESFRTIELQPYTETETREYLAQRLQGAGQSIELLADEQIEDIHELSGGWPGAINHVAREVLVDAMLAGGNEKVASGIFFRLPRKHVLALLIVCVVVLGAWFMNNEKPVNPDQQNPLKADVGVKVEFSGSVVPPQEAAEPVIREPLARVSGGDEIDGSPDVSGSQVDNGETAVDKKVSLESVPLPLPVKPDVSTEPVQGTPSASTSSLQLSAATEPAATLSPSKAAPVPSTAETKSVVPAAPKREAIASNSVGNAWYRAQSPSRLAVQILGTRSESSAKDFVKQNGAEYHYYMKMHQGAPLYVVTYGVFSSRSAADAGLKSLPAKIQAGKPWPKTFASIQQEMR